MSVLVEVRGVCVGGGEESVLVEVRGVCVGLVGGERNWLVEEFDGSAGWMGL